MSAGTHQNDHGPAPASSRPNLMTPIQSLRNQNILLTPQSYPSASPKKSRPDWFAALVQIALGASIGLAIGAVLTGEWIRACLGLACIGVNLGALFLHKRTKGK